MTAQKFQNQSAPTAVLVSAISAIAISCIVSNPDNFPSLTSGEQFQMSLQDSATAAIELVTVTATSGPTFTITRGSAALAHAAGCAAAAVVTAAQFAAMYPNGKAQTGASPYSFDGSLSIMEINPGTPAASAVSIVTAGLVPFRMYVVADGAGNAASYNITLTPDAGLIGGASTYVISNNNGAVRFYWNGTGCRIV